MPIRPILKEFDNVLQRAGPRKLRPIRPKSKSGPLAQFEESGRRMLGLCRCGESSPGMVPVNSGELLGVGRHSKGRNCRLPAPVTGRRRLFIGLFTIDRCRSSKIPSLNVKWPFQMKKTSSWLSFSNQRFSRRSPTRFLPLYFLYFSHVICRVGLVGVQENCWRIVQICSFLFLQILSCSCRFRVNCVGW